MTAQQIIFPVVMRPNLNDPVWREQYQREIRAQIGAQLVPPPRTRPLLAVNNDPAWKKFGAIDGVIWPVPTSAFEKGVAIARDNFDRHARSLRDAFAFSDDVEPSQR